MMFRQATLKEARALMEILKDFTSTSRIKINKDKSGIFFFKTGRKPGRCMGLQSEPGN